MKAADLRSRFIDYFERRGHLPLPSSPIVPRDDPTLMFTNAGMVQFKGVFTGQSDPPASRAVTSQKCLRVSGKHNDLEEVGRTARHHTFFEMLGNFSFGDYFKREAVAFAWEFATDELGLDPGRIWATVHHDDDDAYHLWAELTEIPESRIRRMGDKDNFWQMGDTGPCGPCSELHYDLRSDLDDRITDAQFEAAGDADQIIEFWNLVFMQFDRSVDGVRTSLPAPSIDTGAGLERIAALLQGVGTNYHTDLFLPIIRAAQEGLDREYSLAPEMWNEGVAFRVLADHARAVAFLLADGIVPSNEKRGYVLRRILRRAVRHYWLLGRREPLLDHLAGVVIDQMGDAFPELTARKDHIVTTVEAEEELFLSTIAGGMHEIDRAMPEGGSGTLSGEVAFKLKDTFGIPEDLTGLIARERGYQVDTDGFRRALEAQRQRSRDAGRRGVGVDAGSLGYDAGSSQPKTTVGKRGFEASFAETVGGAVPAQEFVGYDTLRVESEALIAPVGSLVGVDEPMFHLTSNPFYAESGGQVRDTGHICGDGWEVEVRGVREESSGTYLTGRLTRGELPEGTKATVTAQVDEKVRRDTERNHTATHLLHAALRNVLGQHVQQAGSLVAPDRLRFDFTHRAPLSKAELGAIEDEVRETILANHHVVAREVAYEQAIDAGAMALFGEKYGDVVRVIDVPGVSQELCGGTHVRTTGQVGLFSFISETGIAAGVRRVEAFTGHSAFGRARSQDELLQSLAGSLRTPVEGLAGRVQQMLEESKRLEQVVSAQGLKQAVTQVEHLLANGNLGEPRFVSGRIELTSGTDLGAVVDGIRERLPSGAAVLHAVYPEEGRHAFISVVTDDLIRSGLRAGDLVRVSSQATGSGGGGRPHFAQGGIGDPALVSAGFGAAKELATERISGLQG